MCKTSEEITKDNLNNEIKNNEYKSVIMLVERVVETKEKIKKPYGTEEPRKVSRIDVLVLIDEFKKEFEKINEKAREIAQMDGRTIVTYADAEEALKLIKAEKSAFFK